MKKIYVLVMASLCLHNLARAQATLVKPMQLFSYMYPVGNQLLFFGNGDADIFSTNFELWTTDGTEAGTHIVQDIAPGVNGSIPDESVWDNGSGSYRPFIMDSLLYFTASSPIRTYGLWRSNGTAAGTYNVNSTVTFGAGGPFHYPYFCRLGNILYFAASTPAGDNELWRTDGTAAGTFRVKNISPGAASEPTNLIAFNGAIYFSAWNENSGSELWKSDGTDAGTVLVKDFYTGTLGIMDANNGSRIFPWFTVSGNYLYFIGNADASGAIKQRLYRTDGTDAGTIQLNADAIPQGLTDVNGTLFFYGSDNTTGTFGLYKSDGTPGGTVHIPVNNNIVQFPSSSPVTTTFHSFKNKLYFAGAQLQNGVNKHLGIYQSDGTTAGTVLTNEMTLHDEADRNTDFVNDATGSSFFWRSLLDISPTSSDNRIVQMDGATNNYKIYYGASANPGATFLNGDLYFEGRDTTVNTGGTGLYKVHPTLVSTPLPVTWLGFDALLNNAGGVDLHWQTAVESNNKGFTVQRSADGQRYDSLYGVAGAGSSSSVHSYQWTDEHPAAGINFYRIKQSDLDGRSSYSEVRKIEGLSTNRVSVAPNPVRGGRLTLLHHLSPGKARVEIMDMSGRVVSARSVEIRSATLEYDLQGLGKGVYTLRLTAEKQAPLSCLFLKE